MRLAIANDPAMAVTNPKRLSERMKALRKRTGKKQYEVAHALGEPPRTFQSWENGEVETTRENYEKVAKFYGVTVNWILFGSDEEPAMPQAVENGQPTQISDMEARLNKRLDEMQDRIAELRELLSEPAADDAGPEMPPDLAQPPQDPSPTPGPETPPQSDEAAADEPSAG